MSSYASIYIGAYLSVPELTFAQESKVWSCSNKACKSHLKLTERSNRFCSKCGGACSTNLVSKLVTKVPDTSDIEAVLNLKEDTLFTPPCLSAIISEMDVGSLYHKSVDFSDSLNISISDSDISKCISEFENIAEGMLEKLEKAFNHKFEIKFGTLVYYN